MVNSKLRQNTIIYWPSTLLESWYSFYLPENKQIASIWNAFCCREQKPDWRGLIQICDTSVADHAVRDSDMESPSSSGWITSMSTLFNLSTKGEFYAKEISETAEVKKKELSSVKNNEHKNSP